MKDATFKFQLDLCHNFYLTSKNSSCIRCTIAQILHSLLQQILNYMLESYMLDVSTCVLLLKSKFNKQLWYETLMLHLGEINTWDAKLHVGEIFEVKQSSLCDVLSVCSTLYREVSGECYTPVTSAN